LVWEHQLTSHRTHCVQWGTPWKKPKKTTECELPSSLLLALSPLLKPCTRLNPRCPAYLPPAIRQRWVVHTYLHSDTPTHPRTPRHSQVRACCWLLLVAAAAAAAAAVLCPMRHCVYMACGNAPVICSHVVRCCAGSRCRGRWRMRGEASGLPNGNGATESAPRTSTSTYGCTSQHRSLPH
jgi:hypothetical protein